MRGGWGACWRVAQPLLRSGSLVVQQCGIGMYCALVEHTLPAEPQETVGARGAKPTVAAAQGGARCHPAIPAHSACHSVVLTVQTTHLEAGVAAVKAADNDHWREPSASLEHEMR